MAQLVIEVNRAARQYWRDLWHYRKLFKLWKCRNGRIARFVAALSVEVPKRKKRGFAVKVADEWFRRRVNTKVRNHDGFKVAHVPVFARCRISAVVPGASIWPNDYHKVLFSLMVFET